MPIPIKMPALSPTMEEGTLAKWLVTEGDTVSSGDIMAEIETDKATMEFEAVDEGTIAAIMVAEGSEGVEVGTVIAMLAEEGEDLIAAQAAAETDEGVDDKSDDGADAGAGASVHEGDRSKEGAVEEERAEELGAEEPGSEGSRGPPARSDGDPPSKKSESATDSQGDRIIASPLARRIAGQAGLDLSAVEGSGPRGRIVKADVEATTAGQHVADKDTDRRSTELAAPEAGGEPERLPDFGIPYEDTKLGNVRKVIARRLTEAKRAIPHIYLTVDIRLDALLELRGQMNAALEAQGVKLSVNDLLIKALARALAQVPQCNVSFGGTVLREYGRQDISVAVAAPTGLITPIVVDAGAKSVSQISQEMKELAGKARDGKLRPEEYQGGTASLSNLGMFNVKQFDAVINPPQAMILAVGAGEKRPHVVDDVLSVATVMSATGSFDHRAIDGVEGAKLMDAFRTLVENPLGVVA